MESARREQKGETPRVIRRALFLWIGVSAACVLAALGWVVLRGPMALPRSGVFRSVPAALGLTPMAVCFPIWRWRVRRLRRALEESGFRICTAGGIDSHGPVPLTPLRGQCFRRTRAEEGWKWRVPPTGTR